MVWPQRGWCRGDFVLVCECGTNGAARRACGQCRNAPSNSSWHAHNRATVHGATSGTPAGRVRELCQASEPDFTHGDTAVMASYSVSGFVVTH